MIFLYQYKKVIILFTESLFLSLIFVTSESFTSVFSFYCLFCVVFSLFVTVL